MKTAVTDPKPDRIGGIGCLRCAGVTHSICDCDDWCGAEKCAMRPLEHIEIKPQVIRKGRKE